MAFVAGSTRLYQTGQTTSNVTVPAGTAIDQIALVDFWVNPSGITPTPPAGFALHSSVSLAASTRTGTLHRFWKRLSAADSGTYAFTTSSAATQAICTLWSGRITTGSPFDTGTGATATATAPSGVTTAVACPNVAITPTVAGVDLVYVVNNWTNVLTSNTITQSFVDAVRNAAAGGEIVAYKANQPATATGNVSTSGTDNWATMLSALLPPAVAPSVVVRTTNTGSTAIRRAANW